MVFVWIWNGDYGNMFLKMGYGVSVEGNVVHVCEVSDVMASGPMELFVLIEMANSTCVVVSCISLVGRVLTV